MNRFIKTLVAIGVAMVVVRIVKGASRTIVSGRPDITVTGGRGLHVHVPAGEFVDAQGHWRHEHTADEPRTLLVTVPGASCGDFPEDNRADIHTSHGTLVIQRERRAQDDRWDACIRPKDGSRPDQPSSGHLVFWPNQEVTIIDVEVGDDTCPAPTTVVVAQPA